MMDILGGDARAFRALFDNEHAIMLLLDPPTGAIVDANPAAVRFYGWSREALKQRSIFDLNTLPEATIRSQMAAARSQRRSRFVFEHRRADGSICSVRVASGPVHLNGRELLYSIVEDASELNDMRELLRIRDQALEALDTALVLTDREGVIAWCNAAFTRLSGFDVDEALGRRPGDLVHSGVESETFYQQMWETILRGETWSGTLVNRRKDGSLYDEEMTITPVVDAEGRPTHFLAAKRDVTERRAHERALERWQTLFHVTGAGLALSDTTGQRFALVNAAFASMHGFAPEELVGRPFTDVMAPEEVPRLEETLARLERDKHFSFEGYHRRRDGTPFPVTIELTRLDGQAGLHARLLATVMDVSERVALAHRVESLTFVDQLTGLANRRGVQRRLDGLLREAGEQGRRLLLAYVGLDGFRALNATFGPEAGDRVLVQVARALEGEAQMGKGGLWARMGGDVFAWVQPGHVDDEDVTALAQRWQAVCATPLSLAGTEVRMSASVGVAMAPADANDAGGLLAAAESALEEAKQAGGNQVRFFAPRLNRVARERLHLRGALAAAIDNEQLTLAVQPQVDFHDGRVVAVEALVRWTHPEWGPVPPSRFIPEAERAGLVRRLGRWVLDRAVGLLAEGGGLQDLVPRVAVNLSALELADPDLPASVFATLAAHDVPPERLELEVTESAVMTEERTALASLAELRRRGVRIAIDDFGTGYASLTYLQHLPADALKIERQFVHALGADATKTDRAVVDAIVHLARAFGHTVTAEGIETREQYAWLREAGCHYAQGYLLARPMPATELPAWCRRSTFFADDVPPRET